MDLSWGGRGGIADELWSLQRATPGVKVAVDAYTNATRWQPWEEVVCAAFKEPCERQAHKELLARWAVHYPWISPGGFAGFRRRVLRYGRNLEYATSFALQHFSSQSGQKRALEILQVKHKLALDVLDELWLWHGPR